MAKGWQFIQVGRYIERATATAQLLEAYHGDLWGGGHFDKHEGNEYLDWMGLLRSATAFEAYCKVYTADLTPERILEFLLLDAEFPHSLRFSIDAMQTALGLIDRESGGIRDGDAFATCGQGAGYAGLLRRLRRFLRLGVVPYLQRMCRRSAAGFIKRSITCTSTFRFSLRLTGAAGMNQ